MPIAGVVSGLSFRAWDDPSRRRYNQTRRSMAVQYLQFGWNFSASCYVHDAPSAGGIKEPHP
jgi:hypothetical protein